LAAATGLLALISFCLLVFGRVGVGPIVAFLIAGLIVAQIGELPPEPILALREFAEIGVTLLLFLIGLEIQPSQLGKLGWDAITFGAPQVLLSAAVIGIYVWGVVPVVPAWDTAIVLGLGFTMSSTTVVVQILKDRNELHTSWGEKAFAILLAQDIAVVPFLLAVSLLGQRAAGGGSNPLWLWEMARAIIVVVGIPAIGYLGLTRILALAVKQQNDAALTCVTLLGVLAAALAAESIGLSMALGAFLLGTALSISPFGDRIAASVEPIKNILLALFFLSVGLSIDLRTVAADWAPLLLNTLAILVLKFGILLLLALAGRLQRSDAIKLSLALAQCGEFGFVLFAAAQARGLMSPRLTALASILIMISMLGTPFAVRYGARWADSLPQIRRQRDGRKLELNH
jgi:Kef-type K+ transport system membrane component KefB